MSFNGLDVLWVVICAGLVFLMQAGFLCLESGLTRSKNAVNVAIKNVVDFAISAGLYWLFGFALMFGPSLGGWIGSAYFLPATGPATGGWFAAFFLFQMMFCSTSATIVSGAVAERMRFRAYLVTAALIGGLIYPVFGHWAWGGALDHHASGWLARMGFQDFAGSSVVHSVGGWVALAVVLIMGPRRGRFTADGKAQPLVAGNLPMAMLGSMLLFFGWFGFNGGSTLSLDARVPGVLSNTVLGGVAGILTALWLGWRQRGYADVVITLNGAIAGLVAITAGANVVPAWAALLIGAGGALAMVLCEEGLLRLRIDDAVGAIPVHLAAGAWGTLAVGLFGDPELLGTGLSRPEQIAVQGLGIAVCGLWSFGVAYLLLRGMDHLLPLRVEPGDEDVGLNVSEHGARTELNDLLRVMDAQQRSSDLSVRVPADPFSEVGQIASSYNRLLDSLEHAVDQTRAIVRDVRDGIITFGRDGVLLSLNPGAEQLFGTPAAEAVGQPLARLLSEDGGRGRTLVAPAPGEKFEFRVGRPGAEARVLEMSVSSTRVGQRELMTGLVRDVSERRQMEEQLQRERDLAQVTLASIGDGVITTDEAGAVLYLNPMAERLTGWRSADARGQDISHVYRLEGELDGAPIDNPVRGVLLRGQPQRSKQHSLLVRADAQRVPVQDTAAPIRSRQGYLIGVVLVFHDVTLTLQLTRELSHQAAHDALTGMINRREFERRLQGLMADPADAARHHVLCFLDLDQFKVVNDTCGHVAGDELLRQVCGLLRQQVRRSDLLARLGGDEFGVLLHACSVAEAEGIADQLRQTIQDFRFSWEGKTFAIGVSIGLVAIEPGEHDLSRLFSAADAACYSAKERGRNRVHVFRPDDDQILLRQGQMQWVGRLRSALDGDRLRLYVQPIVRLGSEARPHYEVLVRLEEDGRIVSPGSFLPAAERYGLMPQIDAWVFGNVIAWLGDNHRRGAALGSFSINLAGVSLSDERLRSEVRETLQRAQLPPGTVCIEITESSAVANLSKVVEFIAEVKALGCTFALDDFGSGLSSFAYLKNLPVDYLKIDGCFVRNIAEDPTDYAMVQAINAIGHTMGLQTIAEFVETSAVRDALEAIGVDYAQGYLFGRPHPLEDLGEVRVMPR